MAHLFHTLVKLWPPSPPHNANMCPAAAKAERPAAALVQKCDLCAAALFITGGRRRTSEVLFTAPPMQTPERLAIDHPAHSRFVQRLRRTLEEHDDVGTCHLLQHAKHVDATIELSNDDWMKCPSVELPPLVLLGLWSLDYKRELTSPLCITAAQGFTDCLRYLLEHGARPNLAPGGRTALHEACANCHTDCVELLLEHRADPNLLDEDGHAPLHLCRTPQSFRCAKLLVRHGAAIDQPSDDEQETPLHVAAKRGLLSHVHLYLRSNAAVDPSDSQDETPLGAACSAARHPNEQDTQVQVCQLLLLYGADVGAVDKDKRGALHKACRNASHGLVRLLLGHRADVNAIDYNGGSPLSTVLQNAVIKLDMEPHLTVQTLLNHGAQKVWPPAFLKVLRSCAAAPKAIEVLFNAYCRLDVTSKWIDAIPEDTFEAHRPFFESLLALEWTPRSLQHLCRCAIRKLCGHQCQLRVPLLPLPTFLHRYLLLEPEGVIF
ncbi:ankyrin repeat and SOCS box protein 18 isoform X1 [Erpetoichthys calabaricus]|uniref:ankyrin repeat and SOCS box protein 18 isoform X1 n=1 Tax=Erpetoichthys calabaricus TaxID=27687 RepID=UPI002234CC55|nr:ankyrin repeat and SOCS box protein 18 isoform X1 [Erpetoichthys calabaricus]